MSTELNITVDQGATWTKSISWRDSNDQQYSLSNWTARMMVRRTYADNDKKAPLVSLTDDSGITLSDSTYNIVITLTDEQTEDIPAGTYYYDLELISTSQDVTKLLRGKFIVLAEVTR